MEYYAYWNGDQIVAILNAIAGITNSQSFTGLLRVAGVFGLMAAVIGAMFRQKFADAWNFFLVFTLIYMGLVVPKVTVNVIDVRGGTAVPVANVPLGVGVFGAEMSHIGKWLTETYETAFSPADDVARFGRFGILGPQRLLNAAINASLDVPVVKSNLSNLMKDCVIPELIDQPQMVAQFGASADIWTLIGSSGGGASWLNPARLTMVQAPPAAGTPSDIIRGTGAVEASPQTCTDAYTVINGQMALAVNVAINTIAARELPLNSGQSQTPASPGALAAAGTYIKARIEGANALLTGVASTTEQIIKQRATMDALSNGIDASNPMAASVGQAVGVGNLSAAINYRAMPQIAQDALPKLRNSVEMLVIAAFPIMVVMLLVSGLQGLPLFKGYLVMMLWTQLWAPLYAVVNFMMITSDTSPYTALINAYGAQSVAAMSLITQLGASSQDTAGMLALAIPVIALALAKGGEMALTSMASTVMSPATSAAQSSGSQLAQGNSSLGNVSWGNLTEGNSSQFNRTMGSSSVGQGAVGMKADGAQSYSDPRTFKTQSAHGGQTIARGEGPGGSDRLTAATNAGGNQLFTTQASAQEMEAARQTYAQSVSAAQTSMARFASTAGATLTKLNAFSDSGGTRIGAGDRVSSGTSDRIGDRTGTADRAASESGLEGRHSTSREQRAGGQVSARAAITGAMGGAAAGMKRGAPGAVVGALAGLLNGADLTASASGSTQDSTARSGRMTAAQSAEQGRQIEQASQALQSLDGSKMTEGQRSARNDLVGQLASLKQASDDRTAALQTQEQAGRELTRASQRAVTVAANPDNTGGISDPQQMAALQKAVSSGDPAAVFQALSGAQRDVAQSNAAQAFMAQASDSPSAPQGFKSPEQLANEGGGAVRAASAANRAEVATQGAANTAAVDSKAAAAGIDASKPAAAAYLAFAQAALKASEGRVDASTAASAEAFKGQMLAQVPKAMQAFGQEAPFGNDARSLKEFLATPAVTNDGGRIAVNQDLAARQGAIGAAIGRLAANQERGDFREGAKVSEPARQQIESDKAVLRGALW